MKTKLLLIGLLLVTGCGQKSRFEFHPGVNGQLMWRCDRETGQVFLSYGGQPWHAVTGAAEASLCSERVDKEVISRFAAQVADDAVSNLLVAFPAPNLPSTNGTH